MGISFALTPPKDEYEFQDLCRDLFRELWGDEGLMPVGRRGQNQSGVDLIGTKNGRLLGIQCKCYHSTPFTIGTIRKDVERADNAELGIKHLIFATTKKNDQKVVLDVFKLNQERAAAGKFTVSVEFWESLEGELVAHPNVASKYYEYHPNSLSAQAVQQTRKLLEGQQADGDKRDRQHAELIQRLDEIRQASSALAPPTGASEISDLLTRQIDLARDKIESSQIENAIEILEAVKENALAASAYTKFRWLTNHASCLLARGAISAASQEYLQAYECAPEEEKALANRARAYLLTNRIPDGLLACNEGLATFQNSALLWSLAISARDMAGDANPLAGVPEVLMDDPHVLYARSSMHLKANEFPEAYRLARKYMEVDNNSFQAKRLILSIAVAWSAHESVHAHFGHLSPDQKSALEDAVILIENERAFLQKVDFLALKVEVAINSAAAYRLLGKSSKAIEILKAAYENYPREDGLLRQYILCLAEEDEIDSIRELTDERTSQLSLDALISLAEISSNQGDWEWHKEIQAALCSRPLSERERSDLFALRIHAQWTAGYRADAVDEGLLGLSKEPHNALLCGVLARMLFLSGRQGEAASLLTKFAELALKESDTAIVYQAANVAWEMGEHRVCAQLLGKLVVSPSNDLLTRRYLASLVESGQRAKALNVLSRMDDVSRRASPIRRVEANLAADTGDWPRVADLLASETKQYPGEAQVAVGYLSALRAINRGQEIRDYLEMGPEFEHTSPENEFEIAKYEDSFGFSENAFKRLYKLFANRPNDSAIAGYFLALYQMAGGPRTGKFDTVTPGCLVRLESSFGQKLLVLEPTTLEYTGGWAEIVSPESDLWRQVVNRRINDEIEISSGASSVRYMVASIESIYMFAAIKAHEVLGQAATPSGPLTSIPVLDQKGELDVGPLRSALEARAERVRELFSVYRKHRLPVSLFAQLLGVDPVNLYLEWPRRDLDLYVSSGVAESREKEVEAIRKAGRWVVDLFSLTQIAHFNLFDNFISSFGVPLIPSSARDQLLHVVAQFKTHPPEKHMAWRDGRLVITEALEEDVKARLQLLDQISAIVDECEVVPAVGPLDTSSTFELARKALDKESYDCIYLSLEKGALLLSDDAVFRNYAAQAGVEKTASIQAALMYLRDSKDLSQEKYSEVVLAKENLGHSFISIDAKDLVWLLPDAGRVSAVLETFGTATVQLSSAVYVCAEFLRLAAARVAPDELVQYFDFCLEKLSFHPAAQEIEIREVFAWAIYEYLRCAQRPRRNAIRAVLGKRLKLDVPSVRALMVHPIAAAIRREYYGRLDN